MIYQVFHRLKIMASVLVCVFCIGILTSVVFGSYEGIISAPTSLIWVIVSLLLFVFILTNNLVLLSVVILFYVTVLQRYFYLFFREDGFFIRKELISPDAAVFFDISLGLLYSIVSIFAAFLLSCGLRRDHVKKIKVSFAKQKISVFLIICYGVISLTTFFISGYGLPGKEYLVADKFSMFLASLFSYVNYLIPFYIIYFKAHKSKLVYLLLALVISVPIILPSKGFLFELAFALFFAYAILYNRVSDRIVYLALSFVVANMLLYDTLDHLRYLSLTGNMAVHESDFVSRLSLRLSVLDQLYNVNFLDFEMISLWEEIKAFTNRLVPGNLFEIDPFYADFSKHYLLSTRGIDTFGVTGGHGETVGGYATSFVFFGDYSFIYYFCIFFFIFVVEKKANALVLFIVIFIFVILRTLGGGFVLLNHSTITFTFFHFALVFILHVGLKFSGAIQRR